MLYWPHSIDILQPERAFVDGPKPMFFYNQEKPIPEPPITPANQHLYEQHSLERFFFDGQEFGAKQCKCIVFLLGDLLTGLNLGVLVRNNDVRKKLKERVKDPCIIM